MANDPHGLARRSNRSRPEPGPAGKSVAKEKVHASEQRGDKRSNVENETTTSSATSSAMPIVGIGASAGGIGALSNFFDVMSPDSGCAFVVVLHLDPKHESEMAHILGAHTSMPTAQVRDGISIAP